MSKFFKAVFCIFIVVALYGTARTSLSQVINDGENCIQYFTEDPSETSDGIEVMEADILPAGVAKNTTEIEALEAVE